MEVIKQTPFHFCTVALPSYTSETKYNAKLWKVLHLSLETAVKIIFAAVLLQISIEGVICV